MKRSKDRKNKRKKERRKEDKKERTKKEGRKECKKEKEVKKKTKERKKKEREKERMKNGNRTPHQAFIICYPQVIANIWLSILSVYIIKYWCILKIPTQFFICQQMNTI